MAGWRHVMTWATQQRIPCLMINGPAEQEDIGELLQTAPHAVWPCTGTLPLPHLAAIIARCRLLLGHDSGITHLAAAVGTHTLALFGPTDPWTWGPRSPYACVLQTAHLDPLNLANLPASAVIHILDAMWGGRFDFAPSHLGFTIRQMTDGLSSSGAP
jgi:ADP-heptose:LPS heptosyltransferase